MPQENVEMVRGAYEAIARDDWDAVFEAADPDLEFVPPGRSMPQDAWIWSRAATPATLHLTMNERDLNGSIPPEIFRVPAGALAAAPMTLEELASMWKNRTPQNRPWPAP